MERSPSDDDDEEMEEEAEEEEAEEDQDDDEMACEEQQQPPPPVPGEGAPAAAKAGMSDAEAGAVHKLHSLKAPLVSTLGGTNK